jgi:PAS domain S-box-containing protein
VRDIGERKAAEDRIGFQAQLLDKVSQTILTTDRSGGIGFWNRYAQTLFGAEEAEANGMTPLDLMDPQSRPEAIDAFARVLAGEDWSGELVGRRRNGTTFPALVLGTPLYDAAGQVIGSVGVATDISQLRHAEQQANLARGRRVAGAPGARPHDNVASSSSA